MNLSFPGRVILFACLLALAFFAAPGGPRRGALAAQARGQAPSADGQAAPAEGRVQDEPRAEARREGDWLRSARLASVSLGSSPSDQALAATLDRLAAEGATVVLVNSALSNYLDEPAFERELKLLERTASLAHLRGLRVAVCWPVLHVTTPGGQGLSGKGTMRLDHPEWLQQNADRRGRKRRNNPECLNYFYDHGDEHAWMCPNSPYRSYFLDRVARVAAAGVDALWFDDASFDGAAGKWPCSDQYCESSFFEQTGCMFPSRLSLYDMGFKQWILWRHRTLAQLLQEAAARARAANPAVRSIAAVPGCDHLASSLEGLDAAWLPPELDVAWKVEPLSATTGMKDADPLDWLSMMVTYKYCRGVLGERPSWALCAGAEEEDARLVMASALAAQCNPLERGVPAAAGSAGSELRTRIFSWIARHGDDLFQSTSDAPVAVLYSPETRDFVDGVRRGGMYLTPYPPSPAVKWAVASPEESLAQCDYLTEYKGWGMFLIKHHIPFDVLPANRLEGVDLGRYRALILPNIVCLSSETRDAVLGYVMMGGNILITGEKAGTYSEFGLKLRTPTWADIGKTWRRSQSETLYGSGRVAFRKELPGKLFIYDRGWRIADPCLAFLAECGVTPAMAKREPVYVQTYRSEKAVLVHLVNWGRTQRGSLRVERARGAVSLLLPAEAAVKRLVASAPGLADREIPFTVEDGRLTFEADVSVNLLVKVELE